MLKLKNVVFDIGNVLTDFRWKEFAIDRGCSEELAERIGQISVFSKTWKCLDLGTMNRAQVLEEFVKQAPDIESQLRRVFADFADIVTPREYAIPWVKKLKEAGYNVYYLSNFSKDIEEDCKASLAFIPYTDGGILSYKYGVIKPDREIYELLWSEFSLKPEECVFIDDTFENIEASRKYGMEGIVFTSYEDTINQLKNLGISI